MSRRAAALSALLFALPFLAGKLLAGTENELPAFGKVQSIVETYFHDASMRPGEIISKSQVEQVLNAIGEAGWDVADKQEILDATLDDGHVLVSTLRTPAGRRFMNKISTRELMYDRLDRVSQVSGGQQLIRDLVKLPDGEKYAKPKSGGGVPDLLDLLPKKASGKTRRIADYHKPTGHLYTASALVDRLSESYKKQTEQTSTPEKADRRPEQAERSR
jgi:hypothetical protein